MGPEYILLRQGTAGPVYPPRFLTNKTNKKEYRDSVRTWIQMMTSFAEAGTKHRAYMCGAGQFGFMICDAMAQKILRQEEKDEKLSLKEDEPDADRTAFLESSISVLAIKTPVEIVRSEIKIHSHNVACYRRKNKASCKFSTRFRAAATRQFNEFSMISHAIRRQLVAMMLINVNLSFDTMTTIMSHLSMIKLDVRAGSYIEISTSQKNTRKWIVTDQPGIDKEILKTV